MATCDVGVPQPAAGDETRVAWDGQLYTRLEFFEYYREYWNAAWEEALIATAASAPQPGAAQLAVFPLARLAAPLVRLQFVTMGVDPAGLNRFRHAIRDLHAGMAAYVRWMLEREPEIQLDARCFNDPNAGELNRHIGRHPEIIRRLIDHGAFEKWLAHARQRLSDAIYERAEVLEYVAERIEMLQCLPTIHLGLEYFRARGEDHCKCSACWENTDEDRDAERKLYASVRAEVCHRAVGFWHRQPELYDGSSSSGRWEGSVDGQPGQRLPCNE